MDLKRILDRLVRLQPKARGVLPLKQSAERGLLKLLQGAGLRAAERLVSDLNESGHRFRLRVRGPGTRTWSEDVDGGERKVDLYVASTRSHCATSLRYSKAPEPPKPTRARLERDALQQRFYDRYMQVGRKAYRDPRYRLSAVDRRLLLIGELEADVNNGGFSQYLDNKGPRRARSALAALREIGARKTAAMLERALKPGADLEALDSRFYQAPEDLAVLGARHAGFGSPGRKRKAGDQSAR